MQASLYRFKSSIVDSAHTATSAIMNALQHTAVDDDELDFNENMFPCCEENEVNNPGRINLIDFNLIEVFLIRFLYMFLNLLCLKKLRLNCKWLNSFTFIFLPLFVYPSIPLSLPPFLPPLLYFLCSFLKYYDPFPTFSPILSTTSIFSLILYDI